MKRGINIPLKIYEITALVTASNLMYFIPTSLSTYAQVLGPFQNSDIYFGQSSYLVPTV